MTITLDLPESVIINAGAYAQSRQQSLLSIIQQQVRDMAQKYDEQRNVSAELKLLADSFGSMPDLNKYVDLDVLRGRNDHSL